MTALELRRDQLRQELQQQVARQNELEAALRQTQAQVFRLQGALALCEELLTSPNSQGEETSHAERE